MDLHSDGGDGSSVEEDIREDIHFDNSNDIYR